jgi:hypothetical protein
MSNDLETKSWFRGVPVAISAATALLIALTGFIAAVSGLLPWFGTLKKPTDSHGCLAPFVQRLAMAEDFVCVTSETHLRVVQDNQLAASRRDPAGGPYGADTCLSGYVFRDAFPGDRICVEVSTREEAAADNQQAQFRVPR